MSGPAFANRAPHFGGGFLFASAHQRARDQYRLPHCRIGGAGSTPGMAYVILTRDNEPLADIEGQMFTFRARSHAVPFLMPGESIERWTDDQPCGASSNEQ